MQKILYSIAWLLLLIFVAWPIAYFLSWWWVALMPFESMIDARKYRQCCDCLVYRCVYSLKHDPNQILARFYDCQLPM